jgi:hypothetical protein
VFGRDVQIAGCFVHFRRNLRKNLQKQKYLQSLAGSNNRFYVFLCGLVGLVYVPIDEVAAYYKALIDEELPEVLDDIRQKCGQGNDDDFTEFDEIKKSIDNYLKYVENTYIGKAGRLGAWVKPRFAPSIWNHHEATLALESTTTNTNEAFHSGLRKAVRQNSAFWAVVDDLKDVEAKVRVKRDERIVDGNEDLPGPSRKRRPEQTVEFIRKIVLKRETFSTKSTYLLRVSSMRSFD